MRTGWIGVAAIALVVSAGPAWAAAHPSEDPAAPDGLSGARHAAKAVADAEAATLLLPTDARTRVLLGRAYLAAGRFASAETAFGDALTLDSGMSRAAISRALAQIALGKADAARASLAIAEGVAPDADIGLAEALLGDGEAARKRLDAAARAPNADARTRQNLGLVHALAGRWMEAVAVAQQDVPADLMPGRLRRWAMIAQMKADPAMQVGAVLGVLPAADVGQPAALALAVPVPTAPVVLAVVSPPEKAEALVAPIIRREGGSVVTLVKIAAPPLDSLVRAPAVMPMVALPSIEPPAETLPAPLSEQAGSAATVSLPIAGPAKAMAWAGPPRMRAARPPARRAQSTPPVRPVRPTVIHASRSLKPAASMPIRLASQLSVKPIASTGGWAVQLGAFSSARRTEIAWGRLKGRASFIGAYTPTGSGRRWGKAMIYRLSVSGLPTRQDAVRLCLRVKAAGGACFVRAARGDQPMEWAARARGDQPA